MENDEGLVQFFAVQFGAAGLKPNRGSFLLLKNERKEEKLEVEEMGSYGDRSSCTGSSISVPDLHDLNPGLLTNLAPSPSPPSSFISASILDSPSFFHPSSPFAAILVPPGREDDWIFCVPNGLWDLLFSASVSRLVVLRRIHGASGQRCPAPNDPHALPLHSGSSVSYSTPTLFDENADDEERFKKEASTLLSSLFPWKVFPEGPSCDPFVTYEDGVVNRIVVDIGHSPYLGDILIEDVEIDSSLAFRDARSPRNQGIQIRRRMRFKKMPNLIQTEVRATIFRDGNPEPSCTLENVRTVKDLPAVHGEGHAGRCLEVRPDHSELVHKYLPPIVAGFILVSPILERCITRGHKVRVLSIGLGGGALPMFLRRKFGFCVLAVDTDDIVVELARRHFGLKEDACLQVKIQDGIDVVTDIAKDAYRSCSGFLAKIPEGWKQSEVVLESEGCLSGNSSREVQHNDPRVHVIVLDVNAENACLGLLSPPSSFLSRTFLLAARMALHDGGMFVMNVIPRDEHNLRTVIDALHEFFAEIYQIHYEDNFILFALTAKVVDVDLNCNFAVKLLQVVNIDLLDRIDQIH